MVRFYKSYPTEGSEDERFAFAEQMETETGFPFFHFYGDTLDLWSSNRISVPLPSDSYWEHNQILLLENGWYKLSTYRDMERLFVAAFWLKTSLSLKTGI